MRSTIDRDNYYHAIGVTGHLQLTEIMLAGVICAAWAGRSACAADRGRRLGLVTLWVAALLPVAYAVLARPTAYNNVRHFIFVLPPLAVLLLIGPLLPSLRQKRQAVALDSDN